jgi:hypothetical protein
VTGVRRPLVPLGVLPVALPGTEGTYGSNVPGWPAVGGVPVTGGVCPVVGVVVVGGSVPTLSMFVPTWSSGSVTVVLPEAEGVGVPLESLTPERPCDSAGA